jgi:ABC-type antimicrobial peptide transport system permease subunit
VYILYEQLTSVPVRQMTYAVRTEGNPLRYVDAVRETVRRADARVPVASVKTQDAEIEQMLSQEIVFARLCSAFAILALVIACVGLYGTMAYAVARRTIDIGIRMALGARRGRILWTVLRESCALTALGLAISMPIARWASGFVESFLFNVRPNDAGALAAAVAIVVTAGLVAGYGPAWRASRINPLVAIRQD